MKAYTVATGRVDFFNKESKAAARFMSKQEGFLGVYPFAREDGACLWLYRERSDAIRARNLAEAEGIHCGINIMEVEIDGPVSS